MTSTPTKIMRIILGALAGIAVLFFNEKSFPTQSLSDSLRKIVPSSDSLTPMRDRHRVMAARLAIVPNAANEPLLAGTGETQCVDS